MSFRMSVCLSVSCNVVAGMSLCAAPAVVRLSLKFIYAGHFLASAIIFTGRWPRTSSSTLLLLLHHLLLRHLLSCCVSLAVLCVKSMVIMHNSS